MDDWVWWAIAAAALALGELVTSGFFLGPIAVAALVSAVIALAGAPLAVQCVVFVVGAVASVAVLRPVARRHLRTPSLRTGAAALVGARAVVVERVDADGGKVKIGGEVWSARSFDEDDEFEPGSRVEVLQIRGATALVSE